MCFVLIDLKTGKITHQDVGQMDMYIRMYDELKKGADDNPTLGIVLCTETDEDIARYSVLHGMNSCSHQNINCICRQKKSCGKKSKRKKPCFIYSRKKCRASK